MTFTSSSVCYVSSTRPKLLLRLDFPDKEACSNLRGIGRLCATIDAFGRVLHYYMCNFAGPATGLSATALQQEVTDQTIELCWPGGRDFFKVEQLCPCETSCVRAVRHLREAAVDPGSCFFYSSFVRDFELNSAHAALDKDAWVVALLHCMALALCDLAQRKKETRPGDHPAANLIPIKKFVPRHEPIEFSLIHMQDQATGLHALVESAGVPLRHAGN